MTAKRKPGLDSAPDSLLVPEKLATLVHYLRREKVILDSDLAELYGVPTKALNQAVQRNLERFPSDFMFQLTENEMENLRSQIVTSKNAQANLRFQSGISSSRGGRRSLPYAFTEQGVAMLSSVLRSERAVEVNIAIMLTFVQLRRLMDSNALLAEVIFISAFQHLRISAFTSRTRLPHHPIRPCPEKVTTAIQALILVFGMNKEGRNAGKIWVHILPPSPNLPISQSPNLPISQSPNLQSLFPSSHAPSPHLPRRLIHEACQ